MDGERSHLMGDGGEARKRQARRSSNLTRLLILVFIVVVVAAIAVPTAIIYGSKSKSDSLKDDIESDNIRKHLEALQEIANNNPENSRSVLNAYNESAMYVTDKLRSAGFNVTHQYFQLPLNFEYPGSYLRTSFQGVDFDFQQGTQFNVMRYSYPANISAPVWINEDAHGGCVNESFANLTPGHLALLTYTGNCTYYEMVQNAYTNGAGGVIMAYSDAYPTSAPSRSRITGPNMEPDEIIPLPVFSVSYAVGEQLKAFERSMGMLEVTGSSRTEVVVATTFNVIASMPFGDQANTIIVGSHLDSVPAGPGINDNGSGSSVNLELALLFASLNIRPKNKVVFAWWGAEEWGLVGSRYYVRNLHPDAHNNISLNLNMDMLGSPNYFRGVYNGSAAPAGIEKQSETLSQLLEDYFCDEDKKYELLPFTGRSDYGPFIDAIPPIPAGAIATGADGSKTIKERTAFGGFANVPYDTCYHQACDTIDNVDFDVLEDMAEAMAYALDHLMFEGDMQEFLMQRSASYKDATSCIQEKGSHPVIRD